MDPAPPPISPSPYPRPHLQPASGTPCPKCNGQATKEVRFTWWGGVVGPKMMNLTKCTGCGCQFNCKTGKDAMKAIIAYNVVGVIVAALLLVVISLK
jgi:hypothetical protein